MLTDWCFDKFLRVLFLISPVFDSKSYKGFEIPENILIGYL